MNHLYVFAMVIAIVVSFVATKAAEWYRRGGNEWIQTYTGKVFSLRNPSQDSVCIEDIAHALSLLCRFAGQVREFYSVAQHSLIVFDVVSLRCERNGITGVARTRLELAALLHDATEAYVVDLPAPIKRLWELFGYRWLEKRVERVVAQRFGLTAQDFAHPWIKAADLQVLATEARDLLATPDQKWLLRAEPLSRMVVPETSKESETAFLATFEILRARLARQRHTDEASAA